MQTVPRVICDRCGVGKHFFQLKGSWDLCGHCFEDVKAMMLNYQHRNRSGGEEDA